MSTTEVRAQYGTIIKALADLAQQPQIEDDIVARGPVMDRVLSIRAAADALLRAALAAAAPSPERDVTKILLAVAPGEDGMGHEVYATCVKDVEDSLTRMGERIEELESRATAAPSPAAEPTPVPEVLLTALRFYARGEHYHVDDGEDFDTVSGEPQNWLCSGVDDSQTMIEDGRIARHALQGIAGSWIDGDEDGTPQPIEDEVFAVAPMLNGLTASETEAKRCKHGIRAPHECRDCADEPESFDDALEDVYQQCCAAIKPLVDLHDYPGSVVETLQLLVAERLTASETAKNGVASVDELIEAPARHIERLQSKLPHGPSFAPQQVREG